MSPKGDGEELPDRAQRGSQDFVLQVSEKRSSNNIGKKCTNSTDLHYPVLNRCKSLDVRKWRNVQAALDAFLEQLRYC